MASKTEVAVERRNLSPAALYEHAIRRGEAAIVSTGALTAETGKHTGRSPQDKFFVKEPTSQDAIWWHPGNKPIAGEKFDGLLQRMQEFVDTHEVYTQDVFACADPRYRLRGGDQEVDLHRAQLPPTGPKRVSNALLGEHE